jgi:hypothetical protein
LYEPDQDGRTPIHRCAEVGHIKELELLLDAGDKWALISHADLKGNTPLHVAASRGNAEAANLLIDHGADKLSINSAGHSVLSVAVRSWSICRFEDTAKFIRTVGVLLGQQIPIPPSLGPELLCLAAEYGEAGAGAEICRRVSALDSQLVRLTDKHGWTPLMVALHNRNHDIARLLLPFEGRDESNTPSPSADGQHGHRPSRWRPASKELELPRHAAWVRPTNASFQDLTDHPIPFGVSRYYWEVEVVKADNAEICLGLATESRWMRFVVDFYSERLWTYDSQHGMVWGPTRWSSPCYGPKYGQGDTVGCGIDFVKGAIFFTKNGILLGENLYPQDLPYSWAVGRLNHTKKEPPTADTSVVYR